MMIHTDRCTFTCLEDILRDMELEGYSSIKITGAECFAGTTKLGGVLGTVTKEDIQKLLEEDLDMVL